MSETKPDAGSGCAIFFFGAILLSFLLYPWWTAYEARQEFQKGNYITHIVVRVSASTEPGDLFTSAKTQTVVLIEDGQIIKQSLFTDDSAALIKPDDAVDVVTNSDGKIQGVRLHPPLAAAHLPNDEEQRKKDPLGIR